jgi:hypothetical protein
MRETILSELARREWTAYRLAKELRGRLNQQSVYNYVAGRTDLMGESIAMILDVLGLSIVGTHIEATEKKT